jgi:hypothetical protein
MAAPKGKRRELLRRNDRAVVSAKFLTSFNIQFLSDNKKLVVYSIVYSVY